MAIAGLNLPIDIPWQRICVTKDMVDPGRGVADETPPLWQSSIALFRYVPPDEYQIHQGRRIIYYKLTCTITNYQPKDQQVLGTINPYGLAHGTIADEELKRRLAQSLPCTAAVVQVTASASEQDDRDPRAQPYFQEVQPRQRVLYEQVTETQERSSRSLDTLQVRKDAATTNSLEVLDVEHGGGAQVEIAGVKVGGQQAGEWGTKTLGRYDTTLVTTTDGSREARETLAFTTQLSQMYTLLQAYHLGTNRVVFHVTPRPHVVEPPNGISGPRMLDGIQDFFLVVNQAAEDALPCITARMDTGHLMVIPVYDYDESQPPQILTVDAPAPAPIEGDPGATRTSDGESPFYNCWFKSVVSQDSLTAPSGYVITRIEELESIATGRAGLTNVSLPTISQDGRQISIVVTATGYACHRNARGDLANHAALGPLDFVGVDVWAETKDPEPGHVRRSVRVFFRSETPTKKVGDQYALALTTRQLHCCERDVSNLPPKVVDVVPVAPPGGISHAPGGVGVGVVQGTTDTSSSTSPAPTTQTGLSGAQADAGRNVGLSSGFSARNRMSLVDANAMQHWLGEETQRLSTRLLDPIGAKSLDGNLLLRSALSAVLEDPRRRSGLARSAVSLGLSRREAAEIAEGLGRRGGKLTRLDVILAPDTLLESVTKRKGETLLRLRFAAAGLPVVPRQARGGRPAQPPRSIPSGAAGTPPRSRGRRGR